MTRFTAAIGYLLIVVMAATAQRPGGRQPPVKGPPPPPPPALRPPTPPTPPQPAFRPPQPPQPQGPSPQQIAAQQAESLRQTQIAQERARQAQIAQQQQQIQANARQAQLAQERARQAQLAQQQQLQAQERARQAQIAQQQALPKSPSVPPPPPPNSLSKKLPTVPPPPNNPPATKSPNSPPSNPLAIKPQTPAPKTPDNKLPTPLAKTPDNKLPTPIVKTPDTKLPTPIAKTPDNKLPTPLAKSPDNKLPTPLANSPDNKLPTPIVKSPDNKLPTPIAKTPDNKLPTPLAKSPDNKLPTPIVKSPDNKLPTPIAKLPDNKPETSIKPPTLPVKLPEPTLEPQRNPEVVVKKATDEFSRRINLNPVLPKEQDAARKRELERLTAQASQRSTVPSTVDPTRLDAARTRLSEQLVKSLTPPKATLPPQPNKVVVVPGKAGDGPRSISGQSLTDAQGLAMRNLARQNPAAQAFLDRRALRPADLATLRNSLGSVTDAQARLAIIKTTAPSFRLNDRHWLGLFDAQSSVALSARERIVVRRFIDGTPFAGEDLTVIRGCLGAPLPPFLRQCLGRMIEEQQYIQSRGLFLSQFVQFGGPGCTILPAGGVVVCPGCVPTVPVVWIPADPTVFVEGVPQGPGFVCTVVPDAPLEYVESIAIATPAGAEVVLTPAELKAFDDVVKASQSPDILKTMTPAEIRAFLADIYKNGLPTEAGDADGVDRLAPELKLPQKSRYLRFANNTKERQTLKVEVPTPSADDPNASRKLEYSLEPGEVSDLKDGDWRVNAPKVRFSVVSEKGKEMNQFKEKDFVLVPEKDEKGESSYSSATPEVTQIGIKGEEGTD